MPDREDVDDALRRNSIAVGSRLIALYIYGLMGIFIGIAMFFTGAPGVVEARFGGDVRLYLGASSAIGGVFLCVGAIQTAASSARGWWAALLGTVIFGGWTIAMVVTYVAAAVNEGFMIAMPGDDIARTSPRGYVPFLYFFLSALVLLHVVTLLRLGRHKR